MAENITLARPYAKAVFDIAQAGGSLATWSERLAALTQVVGERHVAALIDAPEVTPQQRAGVINTVLGKVMDDAGQNLVRLLAEKSRLSLAPEIATAYEALRADAERVIDVQLRSATDLDKDEQARITAALKKRLGRDVRLACETDPALLGGAVISAGDVIIDGSLASRLQRLAVEMST